jgi:hypothetical protein
VAKVVVFLAEKSVRHAGLSGQQPAGRRTDRF